MGELNVMKPFSEFKMMSDLIDRYVNLPTTDLRFGRPWFGEGENLRVDVFDKDNVMVVRAVVPGVKKDDVQIEIVNNVLSIKAELKKEEEIDRKDYYLHESHYGMMHRNIRLPSNLDLKKILAKFENGIVRIEIPHVELEEEKPVKVHLK